MLSNLIAILYLVFLELESMNFAPLTKYALLGKSFSNFSQIIGTKKSNTILVSFSVSKIGERSSSLSK